MLLSDGRTTSVPRGLACLTLLLLVCRIALLAYDRTHTPTVKEYIQWLNPEKISPTADQKKLYLIWFTADWCQPCKVLEQAAFQNRDVVSLINERFIPVRVVDRKQEDGKNSNKVQTLEGKFHLYVFPTLIVALSPPSLEFVETHVGGVSANGTLQFLRRGLKNAPYREGMEMLLRDKPKEAISTLSAWLADNSWSDDRSTYAALYLSAACINDHNEAEARKVLQQATQKVKIKGWPRDLLTYLDDTKEQLIEKAEEDKTQLQDAHYFAGILLLSKNDTKGARAEFKWIEEHGAQEKYSSQLATVQLKRLDASERQINP